MPPIGARGDDTGSVFLAQYDTAGKLAWANAYPSSKGATIEFSGTLGFLAVAPDGGIYIAGGFDGDGVFGTGSDSETQFVAHLDAMGSFTATGLWVVYPPGLWPSFALASDGSLFSAVCRATSRRLPSHRADDRPGGLVFPDDDLVCRIQSHRIELS